MDISKYFTNKNLGILILIIITIYIIIICLQYQSNTLENFTNNATTGSTLGNLDDNIMTCCDDLKDKINYGTHKQKIDNLLVALHEHHNYDIMGHYIDYAAQVSNKNEKGANDILDKIVKLNSSRDCLHKVQNFLEQSP